MVLVEWLNLLGSFLYLIASVLLYFPSIKIVMIVVFILGSILFLIAASADIYNVKRTDNTFKIEHVFFLCGGTFFTIGSFLFLSSITEYIGLWIFRCGSLCYISGSIIVIYKIHNAQIVNLKSQKICASLLYANGSCLFLLGGVLNELKFSREVFATIWIIASISFTTAGIIHVVVFYKG